MPPGCTGWSCRRRPVSRLSAVSDEATQAQLFERYLGPFAAGLGLRLTEATGDGVRAELEVASHLHQPHGIVNGGVYCSVVETMASIGAALWYGERGQTVGVANSTSFLLSLIHISEPTRLLSISYAVFCLKKK